MNKMTLFNYHFPGKLDYSIENQRKVVRNSMANKLCIDEIESVEDTDTRSQIVHRIRLKK